MTYLVRQIHTATCTISWWGNYAHGNMKQKTSEVSCPVARDLNEEGRRIFGDVSVLQTPWHHETVKSDVLEKQGHWVIIVSIAPRFATLQWTVRHTPTETLVGDKFTLKHAAARLFISWHATNAHTRTLTQYESWITTLLRRMRTHLHPPTQLAGILFHITSAHVKTTERPQAAS